MKEEKITSKSSGGERLALTICGIFSGLYLLNILIGKASIVWGWKLYHLGDVSEFLVLLVVSISIIAVALQREAAEAKKQESNQQ